MIVKRYRLLIVLSAVMWTALSRSVQDSDTQYTTENYIEPETPPTTEAVPEPETIEDYTEPETPPTTEAVTEPETIEDYTEPETPSTEPPGCTYGDKYYDIGEYIYKSNCSDEQCTADGIVVSDTFCDTYSEDQRPCNSKYEPNACCPRCKPPEMIVDPPPPEIIFDPTTPEIAVDPIFIEDLDTTIASDIPTGRVGCWDNKAKFYKPGEYVNYNKCSYTMCTHDGTMVTGTISCETKSGCNRELPPNACCPACQTTRAKQEDRAPRRSPGKSIPRRQEDYETTTAKQEERAPRRSPGKSNPPNNRVDETTTAKQEERAPRRSPGKSNPPNDRVDEARRRRRRNLERTKVKRRAFRDSTEGYRLIRKRSKLSTID